MNYPANDLSNRFGGDNRNRLLRAYFDTPSPKTALSLSNRETVASGDDSLRLARNFADDQAVASRTLPQPPREDSEPPRAAHWSS
jgi:hypothetical protein